VSGGWPTPITAPAIPSAPGSSACVPAAASKPCPSSQPWMAAGWVARHCAKSPAWTMCSARVASLRAGAPPEEVVVIALVCRAGALRIQPVGQAGEAGELQVGARAGQRPGAVAVGMVVAADPAAAQSRAHRAGHVGLDVVAHVQHFARRMSQSRAGGVEEARVGLAGAVVAGMQLEREKMR